MRRALVTVVLLVAGCGYRVTAPGARLPQGIREVRIGLFQNRTAEPNFEAVLTEAFREHYARAGLLGGDAARARLEGTILSVSSPPAVNSAGRGPTYRLTAIVQVNLLKDGVLVSAVTVSQTEDFPSGADVLLTEANRASALRRMAELVVRDAAERLETP